MKKILAILLMIVCLGVSTQSKAQTCSTVPVINSFSPNTGFIGSKVTIFGANFDSNTITNNVVYFGSTKATVVSATFGQLEVIVPVGASTAPISVTNQCNRTAYSTVSFNGIFCPTPMDSQTYNNKAFDLTGISGAYNMISQDLDLDGKPEVISSANGGGLTIAVNNSIPGSLSFTAQNSSAGGQSIYAADFDGDGKKDLLSTYKVSRNTSTMGNVSIAAFQSIPGVSNYQIAAGDFNNDGKIDIIGGLGANVMVAFNTSTGVGNISFGPAQLFGNVGTGCTGIQVADIDGDGKTDFVASQGGANRAVSIRNTTTVGSMTPSAEAPEYWASDSNAADGLGTFPYRAQIADFDKDGKIDFTSCNYSGATNVAIWRNISTVGDITFAPTVNLVAPQNNYRIAVGDVDGDGYPDVVTKSLGINVFSVYKNTSTGAGAPTFATRIDYTSSQQAEVSGIVVGDLDGDFVPDIATSGISSNRILFHRNTSSQVDVTAPTAIAQNVVVALAPNGTVTVTAAQVNNGSSDACGIKTITLSQTLFTCANIGPNPVTLTVTDNAGNVTTANAIVNVQPAAIIVSGQTTVCQGGVIPLTANLGDSYQWFRNGVTIAGATNQNFTATQTGSYTVSVVNAGGCSGTSLPTVVTVNNNPTVNILEGNSVYICSGIAKLTASQSSIYQWMKDGVDIANATQQVYNATVAGNYSVRVIDLFGCSAVSSTVVVASGSPEIGVTEGVNAIANNSISNFGNVFPNVNNTKTFTITNTGNNTLNISQLSISGVDAQYFTLNGAPSSVAANSSATFDVVFNAPNITNYNATVTLNNNDCDESSIIFSLKAEITCVAAAVTVPSDMIINTDVNNCSTTATYSANVAGAPAPNVTYTFTGATTGSGSGTGSGSILNSGVTTVTVTAINPCGNSSQSFTITVVDNVLPVVLTQNATIQLDAAGNASITVADINNGSTDNCAIASVMLDKTSFTCANVGPNTVTLTVTDVNGNVSSATAVVTIQDNVAPIALTQNVTIQLNASGSASITTAAINNGSSDNCGIATLVLSKTAFGCSNVGTNTVTLTVTDVNGNVSTANAIITVQDVTAPTLTTPVSLTVNNDLNKCGAVVNFVAPTATDNCSVVTSANVVHVLNRGQQFFDFANNRFETQNSPGLPLTFMPTDGQKMAVFLQNNSSTHFLYQNVTLPASGPILLTYDLKYRNHFGSFSENQFIAVQIRNASTNALLRTVFKTNPGAAASTPMTSYSFDISEFAGQNVKLQLIDATINNFFFDVLLDNVKISGSTLVNGSFETGDYTGWTVLSSSSSGGTWGIGYGPGTTIVQTAGLASGSNFPVGSTINTFKATDASGNVTEKSFTVKVIDNQLPTVLTQNRTIQLNAAGTASISTADINNGSSDNCGIATIALSKTAFDCSNVGANTVTLTVTDVNGNVSTANATVTVQDNVAPIALTQNVTIQLNASGSASITTAAINNGSSDACGIATLVLSKTAFDCSNVGANTVTLTVTDVNGNVSTANATVTVQDNVAPIALTQNVTIQLNASGSASITATAINNGSNDACGIATLVLSKTAFDCSNVGANTVTLTVTDVNGNVSTANATVTIQDNVAPIALTQNVTIQLNASGSASITTANINNGSSDACGIAKFALSKLSFDCSNVGNNTVTLTVTDVNGNVSTATATVTVQDNIFPTVITQNISVDLVGGNVSITAAQINNGSFDNCSIASISINKSFFDCSSIGNHTVTLTVTDVNGNVSTATAVVTVVGELTTSSIASVPTSTTFTGGVSTNLFLGYGAQSTTLQVSNLVSGGNGVDPRSYTYVWTGTGLTGTNTGSPVFTPTAGGVYVFTVIVTNKYGCKSTASITICVKDIREKDRNGRFTGKVFICHAPPGNVGNSNTLSISVNAVPSHLSQHSFDRLGTCGDAPCTPSPAVAVNSVGGNSTENNVSTIDLNVNSTEFIAYPNPFGKQTTVRFTLPYQEDKATLDIYDLRGVKIQTLFNGNANAQTTYEVQFNGQNLSAGTYFFRLITAKEVKNFKVIMSE